MTRAHLTETLAALNREWVVLAPPGRPAPTSWAACPALAGVELAGVFDAIRAEPDAALLFLLRAQASGDALAGRTVLQAMLGKLVLMASRDPGADLADYLAAAWERIARYPHERRTRRVAANLALDTLKSVKAQARPARVGLPVARGFEPTAEQVLAAGASLGVIDERTVRTLRCVYVEGHDSRTAAERLATSPDAVRWRCSRGVRALRGHALELVDALAS